MPFSFRPGALSYSVPARRQAPCPGKEHQQESDKAAALTDLTVQCSFMLFFLFTFQWLNWHLQGGLSIMNQGGQLCERNGSVEILSQTPRTMNPCKINFLARVHWHLKNHTLIANCTFHDKHQTAFQMLVCAGGQSQTFIMMIHLHRDSSRQVNTPKFTLVPSLTVRSNYASRLFAWCISCKYPYQKMRCRFKNRSSFLPCLQTIALDFSPQTLFSTHMSHPPITVKQHL